MPRKSAPSAGVLVRRLEPSACRGLLEEFLSPPAAQETKELNLSGRDLVDPQLVAAVASIIKSTTWCSSVNLSECSLGLEGFREVCESLVDNR